MFGVILLLAITIIICGVIMICRLERNKDFVKVLQIPKYIAVVTGVFIINYAILTFLWKCGYMDWLWSSFVELFTGNLFIIAGTLDHKAFLLSVLKAFAGLISGTGILIFMWDILPNIIIDVFGIKIDKQENK